MVFGGDRSRFTDMHVQGTLKLRKSLHTSPHVFSLLTVTLFASVPPFLPTRAFLCLLPCMGVTQ